MAKTTKKAKAKPQAKAKGKSKRSAKADAKVKPRKARKKKPRDLCHNQLITIKVTPAEQEMIFSRADRFAGGNVSRFLRHAASTCKTKAPESPAKQSA